MNMRGRVFHWIAVKRYRFAVFWHVIRMPVRLGDKALGSGDLRKANMRLIFERWMAKKPNPNDFGLPTDTAMSKYQERMKNG